MTDGAGRSVPDLVRLHDAARALLETLDAAGVSVVTAESCTGGFLASVLTDIEGLSHSFDRGFVTYSNNAKLDMLGVESELIEREGAVSEAVARAMAESSLARSDGALALAITGFAGEADPAEPEGAGVTYVAAAVHGQTWVYRVDYGERPRCEVRNLAVAAALAVGLRAVKWDKANGV